MTGSVKQADRIEISCENGPISGSYRSSGPIIISNTNFPIKGDFIGNALRLSTTNAEISGNFEAKRDIVAQNLHGKITGTFKAPVDCVIKSTYSPIQGTFIIGQDLRVRRIISSGIPEGPAVSDGLLLRDVALNDRLPYRCRHPDYPQRLDSGQLERCRSRYSS